MHSTADLNLADIDAKVAITALQCAKTVPKSKRCAIDFRVNNTTDVLTALQIGVDYSRAPAGGFAGSGCTLTPPGGLTDVNDNEAARRLTIAYADNGSSFAGPATFASCNYLSANRETPTAAQFSVGVDDAREGVPPSAADPQPTTSVSIGTCDCGPARQNEHGH